MGDRLSLGPVVWVSSLRVGEIEHHHMHITSLSEDEDEQRLDLCFFFFLLFCDSDDETEVEELRVTFLLQDYLEEGVSRHQIYQRLRPELHQAYIG